MQNTSLAGKRVVVLGAGIGGMSAAYELREKLRSVDQVFVVSDSPTFHFVPSNPWVAVHWREPEDIEISAGKYLDRL
jgi:sulfide:quinone oxidoreductase